MRELTGVAPNLTSLPEGGAAVAPLGDRFTPDFVRGSGSYLVPIRCPTGPNELAPSLNLNYSSGSGNGAFGLGWRLNLPRIERRTDRGVPGYTDDDTFVLGDAEVLVPVGGRRYRPQTDNSAWNIERLDAGWRIRTGDGRTLLFGSTEASCAMDGARTFAWHLDEESDAAGNVITYLYHRDGGHLYPLEVRYASFRVRFVHEARRDVLRNGRAGFARALALRVKAIELHAESLAPTLLKTYAFDYLEAANGASLLKQVMLSAQFTEGMAAEGVAASPPLTFAYSSLELTDWRVHEILAQVPPPSLDLPGTALVDLHGNGLPDLLGGAAPRLLCWRNRGNGTLEGPEPIPGVPSVMSLEHENVAFADLDGDGRVELFATDQALQAAFSANATGGFAPDPVVFRQQPSLHLADADRRLMDIDGDGVVDLLHTGRSNFLLFRHRPGVGWQEPEAITRVRGSEDFPDVTLGERGVRLADLTGDGFDDLLEIHSGAAHYWPYLGNGRWGRRVEMDNAPRLPAGFREERLHLVDIDGDGCTDVVYFDIDRTLIWLNQSGNRFGDAVELPVTPFVRNAQVLSADFFGDGRTGFLWSASGTRADSAGCRFLRFGAGKPANLMVSVDSGLGGRTMIEYSSSSAMRLADEEDGNDWRSELPFAIQVVSSIRETDSVSGHTGHTAIRYHDGVYDGMQRAFRGFRRVTAVQAGDESIPGTTQEIEFFQGDPREPDLGERARERALSGSTTRTRSYEHRGAQRVLRAEQVQTWDARLEFSDTDASVFRPFLVESENREISDDGATQRIERTRNLDQDAFGNVLRRTQEWSFAGDAASLLRSEERFSYTANTEAWLVKLPVRHEVRDAEGHPIRIELCYYDGAPFQGLPEGSAAHGLATRRQELSMLASRLPAGYDDGRDFAAQGFALQGSGETRGYYITTQAVERDALGNVIAQHDPLGARFEIHFDDDGLFPIETVDTRGRVTQFEYDLRAGQPAFTRLADGRVMRNGYDALGRLYAQWVNDDAGTERLARRWVLDLDHLPGSVTVYSPRAGGHDAADFDADTPAAIPTDVSVARTFFDGAGHEALMLRPTSDAPDGSRRWIATGHALPNARGLPAITLGATRVDSLAWFTRPAPGEDAIHHRFDSFGHLLHTRGPGPVQFRVERGIRKVEHFEGGQAALDADAAGAPARRESFDARDRIVRIEELVAEGALTTEYELSADGRITVLRDGAGAPLVRYHYAGGEEPVRIEHRDAGTRTYYRNAGGRIVEVVLADGSSLHYSYDVAGRPTRIEHATAGGARTTLRELFYDTDPGAPDDRFLEGRLARVREPDYQVRYSYNRAGKRVSEETTVGGETFATRWEYDFAQEIAAVECPDGRRFEYRFDKAGSVRAVPGIVRDVSYSLEGVVDGLSFDNGVEISMPRDAASRRLAHIAARRGATTLRRLDYEYDAIGNITGMRDEQPDGIERHSFDYDAAHRLTHFEWRENDAGAVIRAGEYRYDPRGNLLRLEENSALDLRYEDPARPGRVTRTIAGAVAYDARGHIRACNDLATIEFDAFDRLRRIVKANGTRIEYVHDLQGRCLLELTTAAGTTTRVLRPSPVFEKRDTHVVRSVFLGNRLVATEKAAGASVELSCMASDHHGSLLLATSAAGAVIAQQRYTPFGSPRLQPTTLDHYLGSERNDDTGLIRLGVRYYAPALGRFLSPDWFVIENPDKPMRMPQGFNAYSYALNNPLVFEDPSGKFLPFIVGFVAGAIYGIADGRDGDAIWSLAKETALTTGIGATLGWATGMMIGGPGLALFGAYMGGFNGIMTGTRQIYQNIQFFEPEGVASLVSDSSWGLLGTTIGNALNVYNLLAAPSSYRGDLSKGCNRQVYDRGFRLKTNFAFTQGNVISNLQSSSKTDGGRSLLRHERNHIAQNRVFGPVYTVSYAVWAVGAGTVGAAIWALGQAEQDFDKSVTDMAYSNNPWELHAYEHGGNDSSKGKLSF